jgi:hypothetical protein
VDQLATCVVLPDLLLNPIRGFSSPADGWERDRSSFHYHVVEKSHDCGLRSPFSPHHSGFAAQHAGRRSDFNIGEVGEGFPVLLSDLLSGTREVKVG